MENEVTQTKVKVECLQCNATGIYSGSQESKGKGIRCTVCWGKGYREIEQQEMASYDILFSCRKKREDIKFLSLTRMPYEEFLKLPEATQDLFLVIDWDKS